MLLSGYLYCPGGVEDREKFLVGRGELSAVIGKEEEACLSLNVQCRRVFNIHD